MHVTCMVVTMHAICEGLQTIKLAVGTIHLRSIV